MSFAIATCLVVLGAFTRLIPHPPNAVAIGALAIYAGARLPRFWGFLVPLAAMFLSDIVLDRGMPDLNLVRLSSYGTLAVVALLAGLSRRPVKPVGRVGQSLAASTAFFLTTNLAVWATLVMAGNAGSPMVYPPTAAGLGACYLAGVPFFGNSVLADLAGVALLFGLDAFALGFVQRSGIPRLAALTTDDPTVGV